LRSAALIGVGLLSPSHGPLPASIMTLLTNPESDLVGSPAPAWVIAA
jgi:hypothetical protein